ncbi:MAG: SoxR reducing system RseC family protein [Bacteroidales bacterium]|nr:SoxR reducing system RseC family protein [Bacteroidales bacterium]
MKNGKKEDCNSSLARVLSIEGNKIGVLVEQNESCAACAAASLCEKTSKAGKTLDVFQSDAKDFSVGEQVLLNVPQSKIYKALALAFVYPLLLIILVCVLSSYVFSLSDTAIVICSVLLVALYYLILYLNRTKPMFNFSLYLSKIHKV